MRNYNCMQKWSNTAMNLKTFCNSNSNVNHDIIITLDNASDPTPSTNSAKIVYTLNAFDKHIMTVTGFGKNNISSTQTCALNVSGNT
jgi:hypothetical protein